LHYYSGILLLTCGKVLQPFRIWPDLNEGRNVHGIGKDGMEAKSSRQSSENHKVSVKILLISSL